MSAATAATEPRAIVYVLFEVRPLPNGDVEFSTIYIAARTSAEAVELWRQTCAAPAPLAFVQSDDLVERDSDARLGVKRAGRGDEVVSRAQYNAWVDAMTRETWSDGERTPPAFIRVVAAGWPKPEADEQPQEAAA